VNIATPKFTLCSGYFDDSLRYDQIEMDGACSMYGRDYKCIQCSGRKI
jgi:hypothetical protein